MNNIPELLRKNNFKVKGLRMNEEQARIQQDPLYLVENEKLSIKTKSGELTKLKLNPIQEKILLIIKDLIKQEKPVRIWILKARQEGVCLGPDTKVLTSDLRWVFIDDIPIGQKIMAVDESATYQMGRKLKVGIVIARRNVYEKAFKITMEDGRELIATPEHRFLCRRRTHTETQWRCVKDIKVDDVIRHITDVWDLSDFEDGWFGGIIDGEGTVRKKDRAGCEMTVSQRPSDVYNRARKYLKDNKYIFREDIDNRLCVPDGGKFSNNPVGRLVLSRMDELFRLIGKTRPSRFVNSLWWEGKSLPGRGKGCEAWRKVISIEPLGQQRMIDLQTSTKTFIAEGFVSHNSTLVEAIIYALTSQKQNINSLILADDLDGSNYLFNMSKLYHNEVDKSLQYELRYSNEKKLEFKNRYSQILVDTSDNLEAGRKYTFQYVHLCLHPDSLVLVDECQVQKIQDVKVGSKIITHLGNPAIIRGISKNKTEDITGSKKLLSIKISGGHHLPIQCTPEHKIFVRTKYGLSENPKYGRGKWLKAKNIKKGDMLGIPLKLTYCAKKKSLNLPKKKVVTGKKWTNGKVKMDFDMGYVFGLYLAEGTVRGGRLTLTMGQGEESILNKVGETISKYISSYAIRQRLDSKTIIGEYNGISFATLLAEKIGRGKDKFVPDCFRRYPKQFILGLLKGYFEGDGYIPDNKDVIYASSIRPQILFQIRDLLLALRIGYSSMDFRAAGKRYGRNCQAIWTLRLHGNTSNKLRQMVGFKIIKRGNGNKIKKDWKMGRRHCWVTVDSISSVESEVVYDLILDHPNHSYRLANGVAVHNSEVAFFRDARKLMSGLNQAIPEIPNTIIIGETTANGVGGYFFEQWQKAKKGETSWTPIFLAWFENPEYSREIVGEFELTDEEGQLKKKYNLTDRQLNWRRYTIKNKCDGSIDTFNQEYPSNDIDCFLVSGNCRFNTNCLKSIQNISVSEGKRGRLVQVHKNVIFENDPKSIYRLYKKPERNEAFVIGADCSEGLEKGDYSTAEVLNAITLEQVCELRCRYEPNVFAQELARLGKFYHDALIGVERNNHGIAVLQELRTLYTNLYYMETFATETQTRTKKLGWITNMKTKPLMVAEGDRIIREALALIYSPDLLSELMTFVRFNDGTTGAQEGCFDDLVIAWLIALQMRKYSKADEPSKEDFKKQMEADRKLEEVASKVRGY